MLYDKDVSTRDMSNYFEEISRRDVGSMKDEEILRESLDEPALFEILVERYQQPLIRAAYRVVKSREEAEDVVQEAFVKMYKNAGAFEKRIGIAFKSWAYKIAVNTAITHYRKLHRGEFLSEDPAMFRDIQDGEEETGEHRLLFLTDAKSEVASVLQKMPKHLRAVLERYYFEDKSYQAIAEEEHISIPTLKMRLFRAKSMFKKLSQ